MGREDTNKTWAGETAAERIIEEQARDQTGQKRITVRIDESEMTSTYASGFRTSATAEEMMLDFGLNMVRVTGQEKSLNEIVFMAKNRIIMNYYTAKRLALGLGLIIRRYEEEFGELQLDAAKRRLPKQDSST